MCDFLRKDEVQAVRIPREFELPGHEAIFHRDDSGRLILEPVTGTKLLELLNSWEPLDESDTLSEIGDPSPEPVRL